MVNFFDNMNAEKILEFSPSVQIIKYKTDTGFLTRKLKEFWIAFNESLNMEIVLCISADIFSDELLKEKLLSEEILSQVSTFSKDNVLIIEITNCGGNINIKPIQKSSNHGISHLELVAYSEGCNDYIYWLHKTASVAVYKKGYTVEYEDSDFNMSSRKEYSIADLDILLNKYVENLNYNKLEKRAFFENKSTFINHYSDCKNSNEYKVKYSHILKNKPEKDMHRSLSKFLRNNLRATIVDEAKLDNDDRLDIQIIADVDAIYVLEIKWLGESIKMSGSAKFDEKKPHTIFGTDEFPKNVKQVFRYIDNLIDKEREQLRWIRLVYFDARLEQSMNHLSMQECKLILEEELHKYFRYYKEPIFLPMLNN